jgi:hypothetical protein
MPLAQPDATPQPPQKASHPPQIATQSQPKARRKQHADPFHPIVRLYNQK